MKTWRFTEIDPRYWGKHYSFTKPSRVWGPVGNPIIERLIGLQNPSSKSSPRSISLMSSQLRHLSCWCHVDVREKTIVFWSTNHEKNAWTLEHLNTFLTNTLTVPRDLFEKPLSSALPWILGCFREDVSGGHADFCTRCKAVLSHHFRILAMTRYQRTPQWKHFPLNGQFQAAFFAASRPKFTLAPLSRLCQYTDQGF